MTTGTSDQAPVSAAETTFAAVPAEPSQPDAGTTPPETAPDAGATEQPADSGTDIDLGIPSDLPPELEARVREIEKGMKAEYTRKTQALAAERRKVTEYDAFMADPIRNMQELAGKYGLTLTAAQAQAAIHAQQQQPGGEAPLPDDWQPSTWGEVLVKAKDMALAEFKQQYAPVFQNVHQLTQQKVEAQLAGIDPEWKNYEAEMTALLREHPTLAKDVPKLYRLAVPTEVIESRATKQAYDRLRKTSDAARVASVSSNARSAPVVPDRVSFGEAVEMAKQQLAQAGRR